MSDRSALRLLVVHELRSIVRDRRTVLLSVVLPLLVLPLVLWGQIAIERSKADAAEQHTHAYAAVGEQAAWVQARVEAGLAATDEAERPRLEPAATDEPEAALAAGDLSAVLVVIEDEPAGRTVEIRFRGDSERSRQGSEALARVLRAARTEARAQALRAVDFPVALDAMFALEDHDQAEQGHTSGAALGRWLMPMVVFLIVLGGQVAAADSLAGEKERGTLETLLTTAARRQDIVRAKLVTIVVVALAITTINIGNLLVYVTLGLLPGSEQVAASLPVLAVVVVSVLLLPVALVISGLLLLLSGYARSFKEAQLFAFPLQLGLLLPAAAAVLPGLSLRSAIVLVPIANASVATREVLAGRFDWLMLAVVVLVDLGLGLWLARAATRILHEERLISPAAQDSEELRGGRPAFERHVWRWVLGAWAVFMLIGLNFGELDIRLQLVINLLVIMLGTSILVARRYRLDLRRAWSLRRPPRVAWLAVLVGVPSAAVVGHGVFRLSGLVFPVPPRVLETFGDTLLPESVPVWQLLVMMTLLPGICEEIFFRGMLLHGLRRRLSGPALCLVVGLVFGFFHVALFRILPTGFLGVVLAAVTLWTGSIFPAMAWHALNNLLGLGLGLMEVDATALPVWGWVLAIAGLALSLGLVWRHRVSLDDEPDDALEGVPPSSSRP